LKSDTVSSSSGYIALPLEQFFAQLQAAGFRMDTARKLRLLQALKQHGAKQIGQFHNLDLKYALAPFVATTPEEQRRFYEFFEAFWLDSEVEADKWAKGETPAVMQPDDKNIVHLPHRLWKKYRWLLLVIPFLLAGWLAVPIWKKWFSPAPQPPVRIEHSLNDGFRREGQRKPFRNATPEIHPDSCRWEVRDSETGLLEFTDTTLHLDWMAKGFGRNKKVILNAGTRGKDSMEVEIHCSNPPAMPQWKAPESPLVPNRFYEFSVVPKDKNANVKWYFQNKFIDTFIRGAKVRYAFPFDGEVTVTCKVYFNEKDCYEVEERRFTIGIPLTVLAPRTEAKLRGWVWLMFWLPMFPAVWFFRRFWKKRREKPTLKPDDELSAQYLLYDKAPYLIPYLSQDGKIRTPPDFFRMADVLRRREDSEHREVDVPASVRATVDSGGFPILLDKHDTTPPDYLFLIERPSAQDQQGRLFARLTTFFCQQDAPLTVFFHDGSFNSFWSDEKPNGVSFDFLHRQYAGYRLVLIGTGHALSNPYDTRLPALRRAPMEALLFWKKALFLSTLPLCSWQAPEVLLHRHFLLYPADMEGIRAGLEALDALEEHDPEPYTKWEETLAQRRTDANPRFRLWDTVEQHRDFLSERAIPSHLLVNKHPESLPSTDFKWLCGLAVSVLPDFALTVAIGKKMCADVTHDGLLRLSRIPWLNQNEPDTILRLALLAQLSPEEERLAREAVVEELEAVSADVMGGYAELEWKTNLVIHRFALDPQDPEHRQTLRDLIYLGLLSEGQMQELDGFVKRRLRPSTGLVHTSDKRGDSIEGYLNQKNDDLTLFNNLLSAASWALISLVLFFLGILKERQWRGQPETLETIFTTLQIIKESEPANSCFFPAHLVSDTLYVLITRFEDYENESDTECYGRGIELRIDQLVRSHKLPIRFCYRDDLAPNQSREADRLRDDFHADLIIWGKLRNAGPDCTADGFCLQFNLSNTLISYVGGEVRKPIPDDFQQDVAVSDIEKGLINMGGERFDDWLIGVSNLKIGKQKPELFVIDDGWDKTKIENAHLTRGNLWAGLGQYLEAIADFDQAIAIDPKNANTYNSRGTAKSELGFYTEAIADFNQAIAIDPKNTIAYKGRGIVKYQLGKYLEAISDFDKALEFNPNDSSILQNLNLAQHMQDQLEPIKGK